MRCNGSRLWSKTLKSDFKYAAHRNIVYPLYGECIQCCYAGIFTSCEML